MRTLISFDYAIKYLLKDKNNHEIVEGFISAVIGSAGYGAIKIKALLDTESNKEYQFLKRSIADLLVEDEDGKYYVVEIDAAHTDSYLHKACFTSSRLIVDNLGLGQQYKDIKKIFHINLLYFPFTDSNAPVRHGKVVFHEIARDHPGDDKIIDGFDSYSIFPEYFLISAPLFDDVIRQELDEWLYVIKNSDVKADFKSPYMKKVAKRLNGLQMSPEERNQYDKYLMETYKNRDYIEAATAAGKAEGLAEGLAEGKNEIARAMLVDGDSVEKIARITGLSIKEIELL